MASQPLGGEAMLERSDAADQRALALDPNFVVAGARLTRNRVERGDLAKASPLDVLRPDAIAV